MSDRKMFRYEVPVDGQPHAIALTHSPGAVAACPRTAGGLVWHLYEIGWGQP